MRPRQKGIPRGVRITAAILLTGVAAFAFSGQAHAAVDKDNPCNVTGWFVNDDETARTPTRTLAGFEFEASDLVHHNTNVRLQRLRPGFFTAAPAPDQPSFFSVEVRDATTDAYGTLRWNKVTASWTLTTNTGTFSAEDPADFIGVQTKWGKITENARVVTFGVGYTASPPGTVKTLVKSVTFAGTTYDFTCPKEVDPSPSPTTASPSPTTSKTASPTPSSSVTPTSQSPSPSRSSTPSATSISTSSAPRTSTPLPVPDIASPDDELPTTGAGLTFVLVAGLSLAVAGVLLVFVTKRRRTRQH